MFSAAFSAPEHDLLWVVIVKQPLFVKQPVRYIFYTNYEVQKSLGRVSFPNYQLISIGVIPISVVIFLSAIDIRFLISGKQTF